MLVKDLWKANCWGLRVSEEWLTNIIAKSGFRIHKISIPNQAENQLVRIAFECPLKDRFNTTFSGWMLLDSEHYWMIREYEYRISYQPNPDGTDVLTTRKFTYDYDRRGFPIAVKHVDRDKFIDVVTKAVKRTKETVREVKLIEEKDPAEREFTLSAFGLPEPLGVHVAGSANRWYLWVSLAGVFVLAFGIFFIWLAHRARRT